MIGKKHFLTNRRLGIAGLAAAVLLPAAALFMRPAAGQNLGGNPNPSAENTGGQGYYGVCCNIALGCAKACSPVNQLGEHWSEDTVAVNFNECVASNNVADNGKMCVSTEVPCGRINVFPNTNCSGKPLSTGPIDSFGCDPTVQSPCSSQIASAARPGRAGRGRGQGAGGADVAALAIRSGSRPS